MTRRTVLLGIAAVGGFLAVDLGAMLYARGPLGLFGRLTTQSFVDAFIAVYGRHPGYRLNHAKGLSVTGYFASNGNGAELSRATVFRAGETPVIGRLSLAGGNPNATDAPGAPRGLGLAFGYPGPAQWRTAMLNLPVFLDNSPEGFHARLLASKPLPATGKPDPAAMAAFLTEHPETAAAMKLVKATPPSAGFADSTFRSLNAFHLVDEAGARTPVRWSLQPIEPPGAAGLAAGPDGLFEGVVRAIRSGPLRWRLLLTVGQESDPTDDPTLPWPAGRRTVDAGTVVIDAVATEAPGNGRDINFDPTVLPDGIDISDDPLLPARAAIYSASFRRRAGESAGVPQIDVGAVTS